MCSHRAYFSCRQISFLAQKLSGEAWGAQHLCIFGEKLMVGNEFGMAAAWMGEGGVFMPQVKDARLYGRAGP